MFSTLKLDVAILAGVVLIMCQIGICTSATAVGTSQHSCCPSSPASSPQDMPTGPCGFADNAPVVANDSGHDSTLDVIDPMPVYIAVSGQITSRIASTARVPAPLHDRAIAFHQILV